MPRPKKAMSVSALALAPLIALTVASAPVAVAAPDEDHCVKLQKSVDGLDRTTIHFMPIRRSPSTKYIAWEVLDRLLWVNWCARHG
jgi:hypothetical protein